MVYSSSSSSFKLLLLLLLVAFRSFFFPSRGKKARETVLLSLSFFFLELVGFGVLCVDQRGFFFFVTLIFLFSQSSLCRSIREMCFLTSIPRRRGDTIVGSRNDAIAKKERKEDDDETFLFEKRRASASTQTGRSDEKKVVSFSSTIRYIYTHTNVFGGGKKQGESRRTRDENLVRRENVRWSRVARGRHARE